MLLARAEEELGRVRAPRLRPGRTQFRRLGPLERGREGVPCGRSTRGVCGLPWRVTQCPRSNSTAWPPTGSKSARSAAGPAGSPKGHGRERLNGLAAAGTAEPASPRRATATAAALAVVSSHGAAGWPHRTHAPLVGPGRPAPSMTEQHPIPGPRARGEQRAERAVRRAPGRARRKKGASPEEGRLHGRACWAEGRAARGVSRRSAAPLGQPLQ